MPPAARVGDNTFCKTPLFGEGSPNVFIGGKPAWRAGDYHTCTAPADPPHVGGNTTGGCPTVLINNSPAAKVGDIIPEKGFVNSIVSGEPTVLICD